MPKRTYEIEEKVINWIDDFADENDVDKSTVANRAIKVYAAKIQSESWEDPRFKDKLDRMFDRK